MTDKKLPEGYDVAASFAAIHKADLEQTSGLMDDDTFHALEIVFDEYGHAERENWEEQGEQDRHIWRIWERIGEFIAAENARREGIRNVSRP